MKVEFNSAIHADLMLQGYRFIVFVPDDGQYNVVPLKDPVTHDKIEFLGYHQFEISSFRVFELLSAVHGFDGSNFFIDSKYFDNLIKNKRVIE